MLGQRMKVDVRSVIPDGPDVIRTYSEYSGQGVIAGAQCRAANNAPERSIPVQDQSLPDISPIVYRVTDRPDIFELVPETPVRWL